MVEDKEKNVQMAVMNDRAEGGSAYKNGRIELLINRRFATDDDLGLGQPLNETDAHG